jgi:flagellar basal-body rod modification protein FlgD
METTNLLSSLGASNNTAPAGQPDRGVNTDKEAFLKLLVAQVSQQDPLSPQDSNQYVEQLTQFSTLEQLMELNSGVETLALGQMSNNSQEALRFVGHEVIARGDRLTHDQGESQEVAYEVKGDAEQANLVIRNEYGEVVFEKGIDPEPGVRRYEWDGRMEDGRSAPSGRYTVSVEASKGDNPVPVDTFVRGQVTGVRFDEGYPELMIGERRIRMTDVVEVM